MHSIKIVRPHRQPDCDVRLPMSKSIVNRMLILKPEQTIPILKAEDGLSDDIKVMMTALQVINTTTSNDDYVTIDLHASGTAMRFLTALCAVTEGRWILKGSHRLCQRPIKPLIDALRGVGADIRYLDREGFPPLMITCIGKPIGGSVVIDGSDSSQYVSALKLVAHRFVAPLHIYIKGVPASAPYIEMTERLVQKVNDGEPVVLERDWSAAAFWLEIKVLMKLFTSFDSKGIRLVGLNTESIQGDRVAEKLFQEIEIGKGLFTWNFLDCPDLVQPAAVCCALMDRQFRFCGVKNLRLKETDRLDALKREFGKLGITIDVREDTISYHPANNQKPHLPNLINTYRDHRMAMAFAACALKYGEVVINEPKVVEKSYPGFWEEMRRAGFGVTSSLLG